MPLYRTDMTEYKQRLKQQLIFRERNTCIIYIYIQVHTEQINRYIPS